MKSLGVLIGGVFVGALAVEIARKNYIETLDKVTNGVRERLAKIPPFQCLEPTKRTSSFPWLREPEPWWKRII